MIIYKKLRHHCACSIRAGSLIALTFLMISCSGTDQENARSGVRALWPARDATFAECMATAARAAYSPIEEAGATVCDTLYTNAFEHMPSYGNDVIKLYKRRISELETEHVEILVAFAGTRAPDIGDILRDIQSQFTTDYENHYGPEHDNALALSGDEEAGAGFDSRWENQAPLVKSAVEAVQEESIALGQEPSTSILVVGHSLGAATATRAAFDLDRSIDGERIELWSFNSPHVGNSEFAISFVNALTTCEFVDEGCFMIRQFTRAGDPVHDLPFLMEHPVWNTEQDIDTRLNTGEPAERELDYCAHYHAPRASTLDLLQNHELDRWFTEVYGIPVEHLDCMQLF